MRRFRQTLQKSRPFLLGFLLVETFFLVDGRQFVYAYQVDQQKKETALRSFAETFGIPVEKLRGGDPSLYDSVESFFAEDVVALARTSVSEIESSIRDLYRELERGLFPADVQPASTLTQEPEGGSSQASGEPFEERPKIRRLPLVPSSDKELTPPSLRSGEAKPLPVRRVEKRATRQEGQAADPRAKSSAVAPSVPRRTISKAGIAPEIVALAESLGNSPSRIFRFVHDSIDFDPKWGAVKPPLGTLWEGAGTSWDQAWLLQDLLTAAGVDARFEWGEVEITPEMLTNVTGVDDPFWAGDLLTTAGVPIVLVVNGSQVVAARMSHVWIKAHVDYIPNRGVTPGPGDTWVRMDPSLNRFDVGEGVRLDEEVPFDLGGYLRSGTLLSPRDDYEEALQAYVDTNNLGVSGLEELKPRKNLIAEDFPFVPGTLRAKVLSVAGEAMEVPGEFQQQLELQVREAGGAVLLAWSTPWPAVYGKRVELAWPGATSADQSALDLHGGVFATPPFQVDLRPSLRVDGAEVASGESIGSAEDVELTAPLTPPQGSPTVALFEMFAGEHASLVVDFGRIPQETVNRYSDGRDAAEADEAEAWALALAGAVFLRSLSGDLEHLSALRYRRLVRLGNVVLAVQRGAVSYAADGTPLTFSVAPPSLDLGSMLLGLFPADGVAGPASNSVSTLELLGSQGSAREGEALTQAFGGDHLTAVSFLTRAAREGQTLTRVDATNVDAALAAADLSLGAEAGVRAGIGRGLIAWISESQLPFDTWDTTGYVLEAPTTGAGSFFLTFERRITPLDGAVTFHAPRDLDVVTTPTDVVATIDTEALESWTLSTRPADGEATTVIATGTGPVENTLLGQFDPTLLLNGLHDLVLTGTDAAGQTLSGRVSVVVEGDMKIGHFSLSFVDLSIPLSGLDIELVRTYDSRQRLEKGDFGQGWTLDIRQGSYRNNRPPGNGWRVTEGFLPCQTAVEADTHETVVRLSDFEVYRFRPRLFNLAPILGGCLARFAFEQEEGPLPGATLEVLGNDEVFWQNGSDQLIDADTLEVFEPASVKLTTRDGRVFHVDLEHGVTHLEDLNANVLTIDADGITHSSGKRVRFVRDGEGRITEIVDPMGSSNLYVYDAAGDLVSMSDRSGSSTDFTYLAEHFLSEVFDPLGNRAVRTEYDDQGRVVRTLDASGKAMEFQHDVAGRREIQVNRLGFSRALEYDDRGNIVREIDETGAITLRTFDGRDNLLSETDPRGKTRTFEYTSEGDLARVVDPLGQVTEITSNERGQIERTKDPLGRMSRQRFDPRGNLLETIDPAGGSVTSTYSAKGLPATVTDAEGNVESFSYDAFGNLIEATDATGNTLLRSYDANGNRVTETSTRILPDGRSESLVTRYSYDELGRQTGVVFPDGTTRSTRYDLAGRVLEEVDELGRKITYTRDLQGRLAVITYPDGTNETRDYDNEGRLVASADRLGRVTRFTWDPVDGLLSTTYPDGSTVFQAYDEAQQLISVIDERGHTTVFSYDAVGRRTKLVNALGGETRFSYDVAGNLTATVEPSGATTLYAYDVLDRLVEIKPPDGSTLRIEYTSCGIWSTPPIP